MVVYLTACFVPQVPVVSEEMVATVHVAVQGKMEALSKKTKILIRPSSFLTFVQTDKPVYKPGQTGESVSHIPFGVVGSE